MRRSRRTPGAATAVSDGSDSLCACCGQQRVDLVPLYTHRDIAVCFGCLDWLDRQRDRRVEGRGGGWSVLAVEAVFFVQDLHRSVDHYERLGFTVRRETTTTAVASRDRAARIQLSMTDWAGRAGHGALSLLVPDVDEVAEAWRRAGVDVVGPDEIDGVREGAHHDPDGNLIRFRAMAASPVA